MFAAFILICDRTCGSNIEQLINLKWFSEVFCLLCVSAFFLPLSSFIPTFSLRIDIIFQTQSVTMPEAFWTSVNILLQKPHIVNKRLWGSKVLFENAFEAKVKHLPCEKLQSINQIDQYRRDLSEKLNLSQSGHPQEYLEVMLLEHLPKTYSEPHAFQLAYKNRNEHSITFCDITPVNVFQKLTPAFTYTIRLQGQHIILDLHTQSDSSSKPGIWLRDVVLPQLNKWAEETVCNKSNKICNESLSLVAHDKYYQKYNELKEKYGKEMVKIWPECTDPSKFVYEDVAIATYLLLLWEDERLLLNSSTLQTFVDLGCGNGLLVYMLTKEGHSGIGIDVRKRQIWAMYSNDIKLEETTIIPSDKHLFPETDWIIGNHSDELTPWIPVLSARSSYKCNFFLLPCCAYNFNGTKYQRQNSSKSQYTEYLEYMKQLCEKCGFKTDTDRLKIPSTKRICLIGRGRTYPEEEHNSECDKIQDIIGASQQHGGNSSSWIQDFKARETTEKVQNCTQLDKTIVSNIVDQITRYLLEECSLDGNWCPGKIVDLSEVVQIVPEDRLRVLKSECGGLQTLLKNNHHIFKVQSGKVQLRYPKTKQEVSNGQQSNKSRGVAIKLQQKPCWFYNNHPQGCPLLDANCSYLHVKN